jgi:hypothetical protein
MSGKITSHIALAVYKLAVYKKALKGKMHER